MWVFWSIEKIILPLFVKHFRILTQLNSYLNTPRYCKFIEKMPKIFRQFLVFQTEKKLERNSWVKVLVLSWMTFITVQRKLAPSDDDFTIYGKEPIILALLDSVLDITKNQWGGITCEIKYLVFTKQLEEDFLTRICKIGYIIIWHISEYLTLCAILYF